MTTQNLTDTSEAQWSVSHPECGATVFDVIAPAHEIADRLAQKHYDNAEIEYAKDKGGAYFAVKVGRWYRAMIGTIGNRLAILHKGDDGSRTLEVAP